MHSAQTDELVRFIIQAESYLRLNLPSIKEMKNVRWGIQEFEAVFGGRDNPEQSDGGDDFYAEILRAFLVGCAPYAR